MSDKSPATRSAKVKTPAQLARRDANVAAAKHRLEVLQQRQRLAADIRKNYGFFGNDDAVIRQFNSQQAKKEAAAYIRLVVAHPKWGQRIGNWIGDRLETMDPIHLKSKLNEFLCRDRNQFFAGDIYEYLKSDQAVSIMKHLTKAA